MCRSVRLASGLLPLLPVLIAVTPHWLGLAPAGAGRENGEVITVRLTEGTSMAAALSPDGRTVAVDLQGTLWVLPAAGGQARPITDEAMDARQPAWSPDGSRIVFQAYRYDTWDIWSIAADGSDLRRHTWGPHDDREPHWSPDGARLAFASDRSGNYDIWELDLASGALRQITDHPANDFMPAWSPDGGGIAFVSDRQEAPGVWAIRDGAERLLAGARGSVNAPAWSPDGADVAFIVIADDRSRVVFRGTTLTEDAEDVFPFRPQWISDSELLYTADGRIKRRPLAGPSRIIAFSADVPVARRAYMPRRRSFPPDGPQETLGIMHPAISPDGRQVAFAALGDLWSMPIGSEPRRLTDDPFVEIHPAWSPDGSSLVFSSDRAGTMDLWLRDLGTGHERRITDLPGNEVAAAWSPDGSRIAFLGDGGLLAHGGILIVDVRTGEISRLRDPLFAPGRPSWSPDGRWLALAALSPYSSRFREGTNQILRLAVSGGAERWFDPMPHRSAGAREDYGPAWSPDGASMALVSDGALVVFPVDREGAPIGPPRRLMADLANTPTWTADGRHILVQTSDSLRLVRVADGSAREIPVDLRWIPKTMTGRQVVHAGRLFDGRTDVLRHDIDILIEGNRIRLVEPHRTDLHAGAIVVDASGQTVMPGLIEMHTHLSKAWGETLGRVWLAFGITTVRNPAANPFEGVEDREAVEAGRRIGPRVFTTGSPFDGTRIYYAGMAGLDGGPQLDLELERARRLGFDLIKTYVRLPDLLQKRVIEYAHRHGMPVTSHEIYPAAAHGADGVEHIRGTSRRGYSPKVTALNRSYRDVIDLLASSGMTITPTMGIHGAFRLLTLRDPSWLDDPRAQALFPASLTADMREYLARERGSDLDARGEALRPLGRFVLEVTRAGGRVLAGTDAPIIPFGLSLHTELEHFVEAGLTPVEALRTATIAAAEALGMADDLGAIDAGWLADLVIVDGDPLSDIRHARRVRRVMKDGELFELDDLLRRPAWHPTSP